MGKDYASLLKVDTDNSESYRIRFTVMVSEKMLKGVKCVKLMRTESGSHIVIKPLPDSAADAKSAVPVFTSSDRAACISMTRLVKQECWLPKSLFGKRYKVKRDKTGNIYICLKEVVEDDGKG